MYTFGSFTRLSSALTSPIPTFSTGFEALNEGLGIGGLPKGKIIEIFGLESSGKTSLALCAIQEIQKLGGVACLIDAEYALNLDYLERLGVNADELVVSHPANGEEALEVACELARSSVIDLIVVDSASALVPKHEIESPMNEPCVGMQSELIKKMIEQLSSAMIQTKCTVIFINQHRPSSYPGKRHVTVIGRALKYYATIRLEIIKGGTIRRKSLPAGFKTRVRVVKNKLAPASLNQQVDLRVMYAA